MRYSACIEWLFADPLPQQNGAGDGPPVRTAFADRIRATKAAGLDAVEFWRWSNKDLDAIVAALDETGLPLAGLLCEPITSITDRSLHAAFLAGLSASIAAAQKLGAPLLIAQMGDLRPGISRIHQHGALVDVLWQAAVLLEGTGIVLAIEPLNDRVDHPGYYLTSTTEGLDLVDAVHRPEIRLLYDIYHSAMMGEAIEAVLSGRLDRVAHVHLADAPGRGEPGSGRLDWQARLDWLEQHGYRGFVGLEYRPSRMTIDTLSFLHAA